LKDGLDWSRGEVFGRSKTKGEWLVMPSLEILFKGRVLKYNWEQHNWDLGIF